ncbi:hypothetical protein LI221_05635 [Faecalimonas umbilicata]|nr:hypothetical protein [Faecalimonas umbilicata]
MYKVIKAFHDLQDAVKTKDGTVYFEYNVGDIYPRKGLNPSEARIAELMGSNNKQETPLIELAEEPGKTEPSVKDTAKKKTAAG